MSGRRRLRRGAPARRRKRTAGWPRRASQRNAVDLGRGLDDRVRLRDQLRLGGLGRAHGPNRPDHRMMVLGDGRLDASEPHRNSRADLADECAGGLRPAVDRRSMNVRSRPVCRAPSQSGGVRRARLSRSAALRMGPSPAGRTRNAPPSSPTNSRASKRRPARRSTPVLSRRFASGWSAAPWSLVHHARRDALEGGVQQEQALVQGEAHGPGGLLQPALALASELPRDVAVREQLRRRRSAAPHSPRKAGGAVARTCSAAVPELASPGSTRRMDDGRRSVKARKLLRARDGPA